MRRLTLFLALILSLLCSYAQSPWEEISQNPNCAGSNHYAYPTPTKELSPSPAGKTPFYISHYGRHGSRFLIGKDEYAKPLELFSKAEQENMLTEKGAEVLRKIELMCAESDNRLGDLTLLGAQQHQEIARRMYERFPEVFVDGVVVDAKSTVVRRSMLSMANELMELKALNPSLRVLSDASEHDMYYMNFDDQDLLLGRYNDATRTFFDEWKKENIHPERCLSALFKEEFIDNIKDKEDLFVKLFNLATIIQDSEIRHSVSLYDIFTSEELYSLWQKNNLEWFCSLGFNSLNGGQQPFCQWNLLHKIIEEADSCLLLDHPGATLRFGHDTIVLPLACLLDLNGYGKLMAPSEVLDNNWVSYRIIPMGANIQFIFYRSDKDDSDVWVKVLLNEEETTLPIAPVEGNYYRWAALREYYLDVLESYKKK